MSAHDKLDIAARKPKCCVRLACKPYEPSSNSSGISHLITPLKAKAAQPWGAVKQWHSQLQCHNTVNLMLSGSFLQSILAPALHHGCQLWGMHNLVKQKQHKSTRSPSAEAQLWDQACAYGCIAGKTGFVTSASCWWQQTLKFWNAIAAIPGDSLT